MKQAALGFRMHSGWGVMVAVCAEADGPLVIERRRIVVMDSSVAGGNQPYHYAAELKSAGSRDFEEHIAKCGALSLKMALAELTETRQKMKGLHFRIVASAVLTGAGRTLPSLEKILAAHPLIHTAEGEFFRDSVRKACETLKIPVEAIPEREVEELMKQAYGSGAARMQKTVLEMGKHIGPPWTCDYKNATLAALVALRQNES